jgi:hypothetical protein
MDFASFVVPLISGLISGAITAVITYFSTRSKIRLDLTAEYDKELRKDRLGVYKDLWKLLKPLARYSPEKPLTYRVVKDTSERMREWYFETGGIYLSRESRGPYFQLKAAMQAIIDDPALADRPDEPLGDLRIQTVLDGGKRLRAGLADDIGTRRGLFG